MHNGIFESNDVLKYLHYSFAAISALIQSGILKSQGANVKQDELSKRKKKKM